MRRALVVSLLLAASCTPATRGAPPETPLPTTGAAPSPSITAAPPPAAEAERPEIEAWLVWTLGGLPSGLAQDVEDLPGIRNAASVASGTAWARWVGTRADFSRPPAGLDFPLEIAAVDPKEYAAVLGGEIPAPLRRLNGAEAVAGRTWASLHGIRPGADVLLDGGGGVHVTGVVDDALIGAHEIVVSRATGAHLGITQPRYMLVTSAPAASIASVSAELRAAVPAGLPVRVRAPREAAFLRHADLTLPQSRLKALFGEFAATPSGGYLSVEERWVRRNIVTTRAPILGEIQCHRRIVPLVRGALRTLGSKGLGHLIDPAQYGGCYAPRFIGRDPGAGLSHHAWGVAIDINVADNPLGAEPTMDPRVVRTFEQWGFVWGGDFIRPDGHHFEFRCFPERCS